MHEKQIGNLKSLDKSELIDLVKNFSQVKIGVLGDIILDEYLLAKPERISREAPILILDYLESNFALGGSSNAANNAAALGASTTLIGVTGFDDGRANVAKICKQGNIQLKDIQEQDRKTTVKTRIISTSNTNPQNGTVFKQQVLRVDRQDRNDIKAETEKQLLDLFSSECKNFDIVLFSDYSSGIFTETFCNKAIEIAKKNDVKIIVDSNGDFLKFKSVYSMTPNQPDLEQLVARDISSEEELNTAAKEVKEKLDIAELLVTRGAKGMNLYSQKVLTKIPAFNLSEVFDVTGAGDTVSATYGIALACGAKAEQAAILGNLAASLVVKKYGTATISNEELLKALS